VHISLNDESPRAGEGDEGRGDEGSSNFEDQTTRAIEEFDPNSAHSSGGGGGGGGGGEKGGKATATSAAAAVNMASHMWMKMTMNRFRGKPLVAGSTYTVTIMSDVGYGLAAAAVRRRGARAREGVEGR